jgi:putative endonuclease
MHPDFAPAVYLLASQRNGTLYIGVTSDLIARLHQHREGLIPGFTRDYGVKRLMWFEMHATMAEAIQREKRIKKWRRAWKLELIEAGNPNWRDLATDLGFAPLE